MIRIKHIDITYPNGHQALLGVDGEVRAGRITGLVGMNGAGKSSLFQAIMGLIKPSRGSIEIADRTITEARKQNLIAYVPQSEAIDWNFPLLVKDVVMMGRYGYMGWLRIASKEDRAIVAESLEKVGMVDLRERQIGELSGGQKKRMFVARALAQRSQVILLDEPFAGVDIQTEMSLIELFRELTKMGCTLLVSTHNLGSVPHYCEDVMLINQRLVACGETSKVFTEENLSQAFGSMLRHLNVAGHDLHKDLDDRSVTVLTDDERPLVLYGEKKKQEIVQ